MLFSIVLSTSITGEINGSAATEGTLYFGIFILLTFLKGLDEFSLVSSIEFMALDTFPDLAFYLAKSIFSFSFLLLTLWPFISLIIF